MPEKNIKLDAVVLVQGAPHARVCGKNHRFARLEVIPPKELAGETYIDRLNCEFRERVSEFLNEAHGLPSPRLRSEREDWLQEVVALGGGVSMIPEHSQISPGHCPASSRVRLSLGRDVTFVSVSGSATHRFFSIFDNSWLRKTGHWPDHNSPAFSY